MAIAEVIVGEPDLLRTKEQRDSILFQGCPYDRSGVAIQFLWRMIEMAVSCRRRADDQAAIGYCIGYIIELLGVC